MQVRKFKLDVVHTYSEFPLGFFGKIISQIYRIPMVHTYHTMYEDYVHYVANGHLITRNGAKIFSRVFCNRAKIVIAPAEKTQKYLSEIGVKRPIRMIPTGLDFSAFATDKFSQADLDAARGELGITSGDRVIITVGRVAKEKSIDVLVGMMPELLTRVPAAKLLVVGDGPEREALAQQARELGVAESVIFAGFRPWEEIGKYYRLAEVFATASTSETQGLTYIEAMAARVPVAVKKDPSFESVIVHNETGYIFNEDKDAAAVIAGALLNPGDAERIVKNGVKAIQPLSAEVFARRVEDVYRELLKLK
jgi:1,2-diacylglycerol 3-alpha-glucosyltransferase